MIDNDYVKLYAKHLGVVATAVFASLNMHANTDGECFPSMETIAEQHGIDRHTVSKAIQKLEEWHMIEIGRAYNRKLKRRKNNQYMLVPRNFWKDLPVEEEVMENVDYGIRNAVGGYSDLPFVINERDESHGSKNATDMASKIPDDGIEVPSNKTHLTKPNELYSLCGQQPTEIPILNSKGSKLLKRASVKKSTSEDFELDVWDSDEAILSLVNNSCKDYQIIGEYFYVQKFSFNNKSVFDAFLKRLLREAKALTWYKIGDIRKTMKWLNECDFDICWGLKAVRNYIDECIATDFIPDGEQRGKLLNAINA